MRALVTCSISKLALSFVRFLCQQEFPELVTRLKVKSDYLDVVKTELKIAKDSHELLNPSASELKVNIIKCCFYANLFAQLNSLWFLLSVTE